MKPESGQATSTGTAQQDWSPTWWQALTLQERQGGELTAGDAAVAARRLQRWRVETPLLTDEAFATHCQAEGFTLETLMALLAEPPAALQQRQGATLPGLVDLTCAYTAPDATNHGFSGKNSFLVLTAPLLRWAATQVRQRLGTDHANPMAVPFTLATAEQAVTATLTAQLPPLIERTLVLEMHVARLQGVLPGATPEERFATFVERLRDPAMALALLEEYPVLARQLVTKVVQTTNAIAEILERLQQDWPALQTTFYQGNHPGALVELSIGAGDTHRQGRSVAILRFAGGQRLVYKPRSLAIDSHFQDLLTWLNQHGAQPPFRTLTILDRQAYGWVEFVAATACTTADEIERFYQRQGGYLALLHALNAADFHFENLIAAGEHPMLIDLEALFHPDIMAYDPNDPGQLAQRALDQSVLSIGMLPQRLQFHAGAAAIDISGIGGNERQLTPDKLPVWEGVGTDEMRLTRRHVEFSSSGHRPQLAGATVDVRTQAGAVADGFAQIYRLLFTHRPALLAPDGPLARFANAEIRVVARATRTYALLLQESSHPDLLRNALDRDRLYTRLWKDVATAPQLARLLPAERRDLHSGDVPIFLTQPAVTHLWDSAGQIIPYFLAESGMGRVQRRIAAMDEADLARQLWYIHASFATLTGGHHHSTSSEPSRHAEANDERLTADMLIAKARAIGDHLAGLAHQHGNHAVWIGLGLDEKESWSLTPLTMHLYDGHAGLALFFAYLGQITAEARYTKLAETALATTLAQAEPLQANFSYIGGFSGWGGLIYTLTHLGQLWQRPDLWAKAADLIDVATQFVDQDTQFDVIGGAAGCIAAAAALHRCTNDPRALVLIKHCAVHLVAQAQVMPNGVGWVVPNMGGQPLAGFSHGAAGIAWALFTAADLCGNPYYRHLAEEALRYERSLFAPAVGNWVDLRSMSETATDHPHEEKFMHAWCHGAPGIGLARLALLPQLRDPLVRCEIEAALQSTASAGFGGGHSLCHGDLGNLELFVKAATMLGQAEWLEKARQLAGSILREVDATGWRCGVPGGVETPGLMTGLAGIGYQLLRLADSEKVPSLLLMEGPQ